MHLSLCHGCERALYGVDFPYKGAHKATSLLVSEVDGLLPADLALLCIGSEPCVSKSLNNGCHLEEVFFPVLAINDNII